jgi:NADH-quinone oxidoreductase subunit M
MTTGAWILIAVIAVPAIGSALVALVPGERGDRIAPLLGVVIGGITLAFTVIVAFVFDHDAAGTMQLATDTSWVPAIDVRFHIGVDGISLPLVLLTSLLSFLCLAYTTRVMPKAARPRAFVAVLLLLEVGLLGTFVALDLVLFFLFFEVVLIPMWFVIAVWGDGERIKAANTFILYTLLGSAIMVIGFLLVHAQTGTFDLVALADGAGAGMARGIQVVAALAMLGGLAVKTPMWPLHTWLPDAHTAAPTVGSVLLAGALLKMGTYGMVRVVLPVVPAGAEVLAPYLGALGVVGILYGSLACLAQTDLKRLIAYSSVGHMGFVLLGISTLTPAGINGALYANIAHGLITGLLFFLVGGIKDRHGSSSFEGVGRALYARAPRLGALLAFAAVASLGLPGLAGFWGEMLALLGSYDPSSALPRGLFLTLMALAGVGAVLTAAYLLQTVRRVCQGPVDAAARRPNTTDVQPFEALTWAPLVVLIVLLGLWPGLLLGLTDPAVGTLFGVGS